MCHVTKYKSGWREDREGAERVTAGLGKTHGSKITAGYKQHRRSGERESPCAPDENPCSTTAGGREAGHPPHKRGTNKRRPFPAANQHPPCQAAPPPPRRPRAPPDPRLLERRDSPEPTRALPLPLPPVITMAASRRPFSVIASVPERPARLSEVSTMAATDLERKRKLPEEEAGGGDPAAADEEDEEERWVGPLPGEAAQAKKRKGKGRSGTLLRLGSERWGRL